MASRTQLQGSTRLNSLDEPASLEAEGEVFTLGEVLSNDQEDPSMAAARNLVPHDLGEAIEAGGTQADFLG